MHARQSDTVGLTEVPIAQKEYIRARDHGFAPQGRTKPAVGTDQLAFVAGVVHTYIRSGDKPEEPKPNQPKQQGWLGRVAAR